MTLGMYNAMSMNSYRHYTNRVNLMSLSIQRLSLGYKINSAKDDPAGLAISEKMRSQIRGLNMAARNTQDAISMLQVADGNLSTVNDILSRMKELAVQAASDTNENSVDRDALSKEFIQLKKEIDDIAKNAKYNGKQRLFIGSAAVGGQNSYWIQTGPNGGDMTELPMPTLDLAVLGLADADIGDRETASKAIAFVENAIKAAVNERATVGALHSRLQFKYDNLKTQELNLTQAESRIRDVDIAEEMANYTKQSILAQVATAMMAQMNSMASRVLELLK